MPGSFPDGELGEAVEFGAIDHQSVRLWLRMPGVTAVSARLEVVGRAPVTATMMPSAATDWTGTLHLTLAAPAPNQPFVCTVGTRRLEGRLAPAPAEHAELVFGFGSCHRPFGLGPDERIRLNAASGIYDAMRTELERVGARLLLLGGDQVYSDELEPLSVRTKLPGDTQHPPPLDVALAAYRRVSRGFLGHAGFRALRNRFPTYCIWDNHDIFKTWGSRLDKSPLDLCLFEAACRAYCEYQHGRNPGGAICGPPYNYTFRWGDIGFLVLDVRGARDYPSGTLLGAEQWQAVRTYLQGDEAAAVQTLFVVSSIPVAHVSRWMAKLFDRLPGSSGDQIRDRWCSAAFVDSRDALLEELFRWQAGSPARQVVLLSGDVHASSAFTIRRRDGEGVIQQFTSSAFSTPHTRVQQFLNSVAVRLPNLFEPRWRFQRNMLVFPNNYGLIRVQPLPEGGHRVRLRIRAWQPRTHTLYTGGRITSSPE